MKPQNYNQKAVHWHHWCLEAMLTALGIMIRASGSGLHASIGQDWPNHIASVSPLHHNFRLLPHEKQQVLSSSRHPPDSTCWTDMRSKAWSFQWFVSIQLTSAGLDKRRTVSKYANERKNAKHCAFPGLQNHILKHLTSQFFLPPVNHTFKMHQSRHDICVVTAWIK